MEPLSHSQWSGKSSPIQQRIIQCDARFVWRDLQNNRPDTSLLAFDGPGKLAFALGR